MIKLDVEDYCQDCESFVPDTSYDSDTAKTYAGFPAVKIVNTIVTCHYRRRCANMVRYLERKLKSNVEES